MRDAERLLRQLARPDAASGSVAQAVADGLYRRAARKRLLSLFSLGLPASAFFGGLVAAAFGHALLAVVEFAAVVAAIGWLVWDVWASRHPGWSDATRVARRLCRRSRWQMMPASYLTSEILAHAGLHRRVAAALGGDVAAARTAAALVRNGFGGDVATLLSTVEAVLLPAAT